MRDYFKNTPAFLLENRRCKATSAGRFCNVNANIFKHRKETIMNLQEIHANTVTLHVKDEKTGETFVRELPLEFYENANFLRLLGEDINGKPSEIVFVSDTGMRQLRDLTGHGPDEDPCGSHRQNAQ